MSSAQQPVRDAVRLAVLPAAAVLLLGLAYAAVQGIGVGELVRDAVVQTGAQPHTGALSSLTVMLWVAAGTAALAVALPRDWRARPLGRLVVGLGALSLVLALDDQYVVHDVVLLRLGIPGELLVAAYPVVTALLLRAGWPDLRERPDRFVLGLALLLLGASVGIDAVQELLTLPDGLRVYVEDGAKLLGAAVWLRWLLVAARDVPVHQPAVPPVG